MAELKFFNVGNADTCLISLDDKRKMLVDYANMRDSSDREDKRCDLPRLLDDDLTNDNIDEFTVVAFTHLDNDHCKGASEYFWLEHADKYQGDDRKKIETLWVPASAITEEGTHNDGRIIRQEARYRLKQGSGIKVFSRPERMEDWLEENGLSIEDRKDLFVDAGKLVPDFSIENDNVEFFVHSPHACRTDDRGIEDRNGDSLVFQARFVVNEYETDVLFTADVDHETLGEIINITKQHNNEDRLHWNIYKLPHHCSYKSIGPEKGDDETEPTEEIKWLCEEQGEKAGYVISSSKKIPAANSSEDKDVQPPHRQAANYYKRNVISRSRFLVTMEKPSSQAPKPILIDITQDGAIYRDSVTSRVASTAGGVAPRAGYSR